jgi:hypothetical protein
MAFDSMELTPTTWEIMNAYNNVYKWSKPESAPFNTNFAAMKPTIRKEAKGTVLIISPFNYPLWLSLPPVVRIQFEISLIVNGPMLIYVGGSHRCRKHGSPQTI